MQKLTEKMPKETYERAIAGLSNETKELLQASQTKELLQASQTKELLQASQTKERVCENAKTDL
jgi:hypothetical protein